MSVTDVNGTTVAIAVNANTHFSDPLPSLNGSRVTITGATKSFARPANSGATLTRHFCPDCGTPLYAAAPGPNPTSVGLRVGSLDQRAELRPARQGWCRSALPWSMDLTQVERFERQP